MNKKLLLFSLAGLLGVGAAVAMFAGSGPSESSSTAPAVATRPSQPATPAAPAFGEEPKGEREPGQRKAASGERKDEAEPKGPRSEREAEMSQHMEEGFGLHVRKAGPAWKAVAYKLRTEGMEEDLATACQDMSAALRDEMRNTEADPAEWVARERELLDQLNASPVANIAADELASIDSLLAELEGA